MLAESRTHKQTDTHTCMHAHTHARTHTHTQSWSKSHCLFMVTSNPKTVVQKVQAGDAGALGEHGTSWADGGVASSGPPILPHPATGHLGHRLQRRCPVPQWGHAGPAYGGWIFFLPLIIMMEICKGIYPVAQSTELCWNITHIMYIEMENSTLHDGIHCCDKFLWASHFHTSFGERGLISRSWFCRTGKTGSCIFYAFIFLYVRNGKQRDLISSWKMSVHTLLPKFRSRWPGSKSLLDDSAKLVC